MAQKWKGKRSIPWHIEIFIVRDVLFLWIIDTHIDRIDMKNAP